MLSEEAVIIESMFMIANKEGEDVNFVLNDEQRLVDENLTGRDLIPKARQLGVSSYFLARALARCLSHRNTRAVVISHDRESTQRMLIKVQYMINHIRGPAPVINNMSKNEITFPKMDSMFYLGTAGSRKFGRGDTITDLHCSEYAFWPNALELASGLFQAVPKSGRISIESTGNGMNDYYNRCMAATSDESTWVVHFLPWSGFKEYSIDLTEEQSQHVIDTISEDYDELEIFGHLTAGQLAWRRTKLEEISFDMRKFKEEYPLTLDECFQASGHSIFWKVLYQPTEMWEKTDTHQYGIVEHPRPEFHYVLGVDAAAGVEKDNAVIEVVCIETMEQVAEWASSRTAPDTLASHVSNIGQHFNEAFIVVESNNHGLVTLSYLDDLYPAYLIYSKPSEQHGDEGRLNSLGWRTTAKSKPLMIGALRKALASDLMIHSPVLRAELSTFVEHDGGQLAAEEGCHDDHVIALACAVVGLEQAGLVMGNPVLLRSPHETVDPFTFENIIAELKTASAGNFPISSQHAGSESAEVRQAWARSQRLF
jgi:hypothetical protein